mgnify:CR=1 FL=1
MRPTLIVRQIMQQFGKNRIFTNKYENCRTVKCYYGGLKDGELVAYIKDMLARNDVKCTVKARIAKNRTNCWSPASSLIVRLPL